MTRLLISAVAALMVSTGIFVGLGKLLASSERSYLGTKYVDVVLRVIPPPKVLKSDEATTKTPSPNSIREAVLDEIRILPPFSEFLIMTSWQSIARNPPSRLKLDAVQLESFSEELDKI